MQPLHTFPTHLRPWWLLLFISAPALAAEPLTLERAVSLAMERSPSLVTSETEAALARAQAQGASLLFQSNPELEVAAGPRMREGGNSLDLGLGVSQQLEIFGQRGARRAVAEALVVGSEARLQARRIELAAEVREAFGRALAAEQGVQITEEARRLAEEALRAAEQRLEAGATSRIEVNAARVELGRARREYAAVTQRRAVALGALRLLIGLEAQEELRLEGSLSANAGPPVDVEALVEQALAGRADVRAARAELEAAQAERTLAAREALPSPRLGVAYSREEDAQIIQGTLGIALPLFQRNQAARGISAARVAQAERLLQALERGVRLEVRLSAERLRGAQEAVAAGSGDVLAAQEENLALINEAYRAGKVDFFELLIIRRESLDARRASIEALEELNAAQAQLKRVVGSIQ